MVTSDQTALLLIKIYHFAEHALFFAKLQVYNRLTGLTIKN